MPIRASMADSTLVSLENKAYHKLTKEGAAERSKNNTFTRLPSNPMALYVKLFNSFASLPVITFSWGGGITKNAYFYHLRVVQVI